MFTTKCQVQNDRTNREKILCFCQILQFRLYFAIKTSIFKLRTPLRLLCLINSFYRRSVSRMYKGSNRSNISNISNIWTRFNRSNSIDPIYTSTLLFRKKCRRYSCDWFLLTINRKHPYLAYIVYIWIYLYIFWFVLLYMLYICCIFCIYMGVYG